MTKPLSKDLPPAARITAILSGYQQAVLLQTAAQLKLDRYLSSQPTSSTNIALNQNLDPVMCYRFLRALAGLGIIDELPGELFASNHNTAALELANSVMFGPESLKLWQSLEQVLASGQPPFESEFEEPVYSYIARDPERQARWNAWCSSTVEAWFDAVIPQLRLNNDEVIFDIGGGNGALLNRILCANERLTGTLFDLPAAVANFPEVFDYTVRARVSCIPGDMFETIPQGGDVYVLSRVLFNWSDADAVKILERIHDAMSQHSRLLVVENVMPPIGDPLRSIFALNDLNLFLVFGSRHHETADIDDFLQQAGFGAVEHRVCKNENGSDWVIFEAHRRAE